MALSTSMTSFFTLQNRNIINYGTSPDFHTRTSSINGFFFLSPPVSFKTKPSRSRQLLTAVPAIPAQEFGSPLSNETNMSMLDKALVFDLKGNGIPISDLWKHRKAVVAFARHFGCVFCRKRADYLASKKLPIISQRSINWDAVRVAEPKARGSDLTGHFRFSTTQTRSNNGEIRSCNCSMEVTEQQPEATQPRPVKIVSIFGDGSISPLQSAPWQDVLLHTEQMDAAGVALVIIGPGSVDQAKAFYEHTKFEGEVYADPNHSSYDALEFVSGVLTTFTPKAGLKIIELYMEGYRQDWGLSFQKDTVSRGGWQQGGIIVAGPGKMNISYIHKDKEAGDDPPIEDIMKACCS